MSTLGKRYTWYKQEDIDSWPPNHKRCRKCDCVKHLDEFHKHKGMYLGVTNHCKLCRKTAVRSKPKDVKKHMLRGAQGRAKARGMECTITTNDIIIPELCPVFGVPLVPWTEYAPSLDRHDSSRGYTPDNIVVMSRRANLLKNNATPDEIIALARYIRSVQ